jgi:hypothetical protein
VSADPWEPPCSPSLRYDVAYRPDVIHLGGIDRIYDDEAADPDWRPRRVVFVIPAREVEPLLWEGDDS